MTSELANNSSHCDDLKFCDQNNEETLLSGNNSDDTSETSK